MNFRKIFYISSFISDQAFNHLAEHSIDVILPSLENEFWTLCSPHLFQQLPSPRSDLTWAIIRDFWDNTRQKQPLLWQRFFKNRCITGPWSSLTPHLQQIEALYHTFYLVLATFAPGWGIQGWMQFWINLSLSDIAIAIQKLRTKDLNRSLASRTTVWSSNR